MTPRRSTARGGKITKASSTKATTRATSTLFSAVMGLTNNHRASLGGGEGVVVGGGGRRTGGSSSSSSSYSSRSIVAAAADCVADGGKVAIESNGDGDGGGCGTPTRRIREDGTRRMENTPTAAARGGDATSPYKGAGSPGGYDILMALSGANSYAHHHHRRPMTSSTNDDGDIRDDEERRRDLDDPELSTKEEWRDATVHFVSTTTTRVYDDDEHEDEDGEGGNGDGDGDGNGTKGDGRAKTRQDLTGVFGECHASSLTMTTTIIEATRHANDEDEDDGAIDERSRRCRRDDRDSGGRRRRPRGKESTSREPRVLGAMDWSLKRRVRLECVPGRCLPFAASVPSCPHDEGRVQRLALLHLSGNGEYDDNDVAMDDDVYDDDDDGTSRSRDRCMARWLASTMYYQHPAVHPLPSSLLSSSTSSTIDGAIEMMGGEENGGQRKRRRPLSGMKKDDGIDSSTGRDLSSYILGEANLGSVGRQHTIHDRVRLPGIGCMGGLGASMPFDANGIAKAGVVFGDKSKGGGRRRQSIGPSAPIVSTISSMLHQRRRDWQVAFRSAYQSWRSRLNRIGRRARRRITHNRTRTRHNREGNDELPTQDEASRCSFYSVSPDRVILFRGGRFDDDADSHMEPVIVFSSTTQHLRSRLKNMGVDLRLFGRSKRGEGARGGKNGNQSLLFSESLLDEDAENLISRDGDAESVHAELDAIKHADDDGGKVTVEVKTRRRRRRKCGKSLTGDCGPVDLRSPLFVSGDDDCAAVYELLLNTWGLSDVGPETGKSRTNTSNGVPTVPSDVPLLLTRRVLFVMSYLMSRSC
jgi:hypothetical protein